MSLSRNPFLIPGIALGILAIAAFLLVYPPQSVSVPAENTPSQIASVGTSDLPIANVSPLSAAKTEPQPSRSQSQVETKPDGKAPPDNGSVKRIENPYPTPPESFLTVNDWARGALVNILCSSTADGVRPTSGSGVIIDPRGVILTNAHVAQYVLLSENSQVNLSCVIRTGSPARESWIAAVLFIPPAWVEEHASDLVASAPTETGEHDYALLLITRSLEGNPISLPASFPALGVDTREAIGFLGDQVLTAGYPAEFIGSVAAQSQLNVASSITSIKDLLTFKTSTVDLISLGGVAEAQSGSSGGPVVNAWGRLIGLITTTSEGATTAERDLRALTISYINRDIKGQSGSDLASILNGNLAAEAAAFRNAVAPHLTQLLIDQISSKPR